jgi:hypothetical protein
MERQHGDRRGAAAVWCGRTQGKDARLLRARFCTGGPYTGAHGREPRGLARLG